MSRTSSKKAIHLRIFTGGLAATLSLLFSLSPVAHAEEPQHISDFDVYGYEDTVEVKVEGSYTYKSDDPTVPGSFGDISSDRLSSDALYAHREVTQSVPYDPCVNEVDAPIPTGERAVWRCYTTPTPSSGESTPTTNESGVPDTLTLAYEAAARVRIPGAGLTHQPRTKFYTNYNLPTIAYVTTPTHTLTVTLNGMSVPVRATAVRYTWDWGDGTTPTVTTKEGIPYSEDHSVNNRDPAYILHHYKPLNGWRPGDADPYPGGSRTIALTTQWHITITNPYNGETLTLPTPITTTEVSHPQPLHHLIPTTTDTYEENHGK